MKIIGKLKVQAQDLLGKLSINYYIDGEVFYYFNDSNEAAFFYDSTCKIKSEKDLTKYLKLVNFFLSCFNIESVNPYDIIFKIRLNRTMNLIQFEKAFSSKRMFFTDKVCKNYLKKIKDFQYGKFIFSSSNLNISFNREDFLEEQLEHFLEKDFLKLILKNKVCREKPYLSNEDISFFRINLGSEDIFL